MREPGTRKLVYDKARRTIVPKRHNRLAWVLWWLKRLFDKEPAMPQPPPPRQPIH